MDRPQQIVLVRHAESQRNEAKKGATFFADDAARRTIKGVPDHRIGLTKTGQEQAFATGHVLRQQFDLFDYIYHSGYRRTEETVEGILTAYAQSEVDAMQIRQEIDLRERDPGYTYDMTTEEAKEQFPWLQDYWDTFGPIMSRPPGGESIADIVSRVRSFYETILRARRKGERVLIVCHGGVVRAFRWLFEIAAHANDYEWADEDQPRNCSVTVYSFNKEVQRLVCDTYNQIYY